METPIVNRIRSSLVEKRENIKEWLNTTPPDKRQINLGAQSEEAVRTHLEKIDGVIKESSLDTFGHCTVCGETVDEECLEMDYTSSVCLDHLSPEEARSLELELELAQDVQRSLLPQQVVDISGLEVAAFSRPAQIVGGDYFDYFTYQDGNNGITIADVAGHGVSASLLMASVQTLLRTLVPVNISPTDVLRQMHHLYRNNIRFTTFVTVFIGAFEPTDHTFTYCNAGHPPPLVLRNTRGEENELLWLNPTGPAIGLIDEAEYREGTVKLFPGDLLIMYTDGVTEAVNSENEEFGRERLANVIKRYRHLPADQIIKEIRQAMRDFTQGVPLADDTTFLICRIGAV